MDRKAATRTDALEGFLAVAQQSKGASAVRIIDVVLKHKEIFVFGELLAYPNIQAVSHLVLPHSVF